LERFLHLARSHPDLIASWILAEQGLVPAQQPYFFLGEPTVYLEPPVLETDRLILRLAARKDAAAILDFYVANKAFLTPVEPERVEGFYTLSFWQEQVEKARFEFSQAQSLKLCLFKKTDPNRILGKINFHQIQWGISHSCLLGYSLAEQAQGKGYMTEALKPALRFMFMDMNLHRIGANYMPRNQRSGNLLRRLGFVVEGYARDYLLINGTWEDHILTSLTNPAWRQE
jgi:ribosomal-protein-alanine N-acetyltransferase